MNSYEILSGQGQVSRLSAKEKAEDEFDSFRIQQDASFVSDFDRFVDEAGALPSGSGTDDRKSKDRKANGETDAGETDAGKRTTTIND